MELHVTHQKSNGVKLQIWHDTGGAWRCQVLTEGGEQVIYLDDQAELNSYIAHQIDLFVSEYERAQA
jgi:hypothetical protein